MSDKNRNSDRRTVAEKAQADIVEASPSSDNPTTYLVQYPDGSLEQEPANEKNRLLFEEDVLGPIVDGGEVIFADNPAIDEIRFEADLEADSYSITVDEDTVIVPPGEIDRCLRAFREDYQADDNSGAELHGLYSDIINEQVRRSVVEEFLDRYPDDRVRVTGNGWVVDDTFLVTYEAENYLVADTETFVVEGGDVVLREEDHQFLDLTFGSLDSEREVRTPDGGGRRTSGASSTSTDDVTSGNEEDTVVLGVDEQVFLSTVEVLLYPEDYLDQELIDEVEQAREEADESDEISDTASTVGVNAFKDPTSGLVHFHGLDKHTLRATFNVTEQLLDMLHFNEFDHVGVHELLHRERELANAPFDVFYDTDNDDPERWSHIESVAKGAPIDDEHREQLKQMFGPTV